MAASLDLFPWFKNFNITPVTDWEHFINPQFNVTINEADAALENHVLSRAGSYGKQIGRMQEVLDIVLERAQFEGLSAAEQQLIDKYKKTRARVVAAVKERKMHDVTDWLGELAELRASDRERFDEYARRLDDFLRRNRAQ